MPITGGTLADLGRDLRARLSPKRGPANCGLLVSPRGALWIDTPYDPFPAGQFLVESQELLPGGADIGRVIVTQAGGGHRWGTGMLPDAEIIPAREARGPVHRGPTPQRQHAPVAGSDPSTFLGAYPGRHFGAFDRSPTEVVRPTACLTGELELTLGEYTVQVPSLPPAHTAGG